MSFLKTQESVSLSTIPVGCLQLLWVEDEPEEGTYMLLEHKLFSNFSKLIL